MLNIPFPPAADPGGYTHLMPSGIPVGAVIAFAGELYTKGETPVTGKTFIDSWGWLVCDGRLLDIHDYPLLYQALGTRYAQADDKDEKKFRLPDYRGYFLRMVDKDAGNDPDQKDRHLMDGTKSAAVGSIQACALQKHVHKYCNPLSSAGGGEGSGAIPDQVKIDTGEPVAADSSIKLELSEHETRPLNMYVYYFIKCN